MMHGLAPSPPLLPDFTSFNLSLCTTFFSVDLFKSRVIILSICVSEPVSVLATPCHTEQTATVVGSLEEQEEEGGEE